MRILVVIHDFQAGGAERIAIRLASRWARDGEEVAIVAGSERGELRPLVGKGVALLMPRTTIHRARLSRMRLAGFAARNVRTFAPDVIFLPGNFYAGMAAWLKIGLGDRCPPIVVKLSNRLRRAERSRFGQTVFDALMTVKTGFADHLVLMSPELLDEARRSIPWRAERRSVVEQPVLDDDPAEIPTVRNRDVPLIVAAGRLSRQKNFAGLLDAVALLDRPFRLVIHGDGPARKRLEEKIVELDLGAKVSMPGYADLAAELAGASLFVSSSIYEGFPSVLVEALAAGVPVLTTDSSPAITAIVGDAAAGSVVPINDPAALARAIGERLDRPPPDRASLRHGVDRYRLGSSAKQYVVLFRRLALRESR